MRSGWPIFVKSRGKFVECKAPADVRLVLEPAVLDANRKLRERDRIEGEWQELAAEVGRQLGEVHKALCEKGIGGDFNSVCVLVNLHAKQISEALHAGCYATDVVGHKNNVKAIETLRERRLSQMNAREAEYWADHYPFAEGVDGDQQQAGAAAMLSQWGVMQLMGLQPLPGLDRVGDNSIPRPNAAKAVIGVNGTTMYPGTAFEHQQQVLGIGSPHENLKPVPDFGNRSDVHGLPPAANVGGGSPDAVGGDASVGLAAPQPRRVNVGGAAAPRGDEPKLVQQSMEPEWLRFDDERRRAHEFEERIRRGEFGDDGRRIWMNAWREGMATVERNARQTNKSAAHRATVKPGAEIEHATAV